MAIRIRPLNKVASLQAWYARRIGQALSRASLRFKHAVWNGFLFRAIKRDERVVVDIIDPPAYLLLLGRVSMSGSVPPIYDTAPVTRYDNLLLTFAEGRDVFYEGGLLVVKTPEPQFYTSTKASEQVLGTDSGFIYTVRIDAEYGFRVRSGAHRCLADLLIAYPLTGNTFAEANRSNAQMRYVIQCVIPQRSMSTFVQDEDTGAWSRENRTQLEAESRITLTLYDSVLRDRGLLPFCLKMDTYPGASQAFNAYTQQYCIWIVAVAESFTDDQGDSFYRITLCMQVVTDMRTDYDHYGARGLWLATLHISMEGEVSWIGEVLLDVSSSAAQPHLLSEGQLNERYSYNEYLGSAPILFPSGSAVFSCAYRVLYSDDMQETQNTLFTLDLAWISRLGALIRRQNLISVVHAEDSYEDFCIPIGTALGEDEAEAILIALPSPANLSESGSSIVVISVTEEGAQVIAQQAIGFWRCIAGYRERLVAISSIYWYSRTNLSNKVCAIGNHKFLFFVSANIQLQSPIYPSGDIAVGLFDRATGVLGLVGIVDSTQRSSVGSYKAGGLDCIRKEQADEQGNIISKATVLATCGPTPEQGGSTVHGSTWISYDSGEHWSKLAEFGSGIGAFYAGNAIQERKSQFLQG